MGKASARKRLHRNNAAPSSFGSKGAFGEGIWSRLALILVALMLVATSLGLLAFTVVPTLYDWSRMRQWQPALAHVESVRLHKATMARGAASYAAVVQYRYRAGGTEHIGTRAAVEGTGDSWLGFHQQLVDRLLSARQTGTPVQVWVNPANPKESVVDRSLRAGPLVSNLFVAGAAGGAGLLVLVMLRVLRSGRREAKGV
ncbi:MAG: DUF3592 domain-containing protein [Acidovorax sp.]|uniref:DUF3592 domain-containing protein n=1 Tax=Acidovorax sp. TaxID=1872122 RepID=UPI00391B3835